MAGKQTLGHGQKAFAIGVCCVAAAYCAYTLVAGLASGRIAGLRHGTVDWLTEPEWFVAMAALYAIGIGLFARAGIQAARAPDKSDERQCACHR
jgi:di/tricarboxylate transporter